MPVDTGLNLPFKMGSGPHRDMTERQPHILPDTDQWSECVIPVSASYDCIYSRRLGTSKRSVELVHKLQPLSTTISHHK